MWNVRSIVRTAYQVPIISVWFGEPNTLGAVELIAVDPKVHEEPLVGCSLPQPFAAAAAAVAAASALASRVTRARERAQSCMGCKLCAARLWFARQRR